MVDSTLAPVQEARQSRLRHWASRLALLALLVVVVAGGTSLLGVKTQTTTAEHGGYTLSVDYPRTARAGLDVTWQVTVTRPGGFDKTLTLALSASQFDIYEHQAFYPEPDSQTRTADDLILTFTAPPGDEFVLSFDAYVQPSSQTGRDGEVSVLEDGEPAVTVSYSTWLAP